MTFEKLEADQAELDCGAGQMTVERTEQSRAERFRRNGIRSSERRCDRTIDGECSMENWKLTLAGAQTDFNYDLSCGMGELKVGDDSYNTKGETDQQQRF